MAPRKRTQWQRKNPNPFESVGALLAHFRVVAGLTQAELATRVIISESKLASIEQGRRPLALSLAQELDELLRTKGTLEVAVRHLPDVDAAIPVWAMEFIDLERRALTLSSYENQVVPGLLQTEEYMRAVFRTDIPMLTDEDIEYRINARLERQEILQRKVPPAVSFVVSEAMLRDRIGGDEVHLAQVRNLREYAEMPGVSLQVLPLGRATHAGLSGPFVVLETPEHEHLAYAETQRGGQLIYDADEVSILARKYAMLRTQALDPEGTRGLLDRLLGEQ
jgi:transcriptional regulator with XRE-family HTH domain